MANFLSRAIDAISGRRDVAAEQVQAAVQAQIQSLLSQPWAHIQPVMPVYPPFGANIPIREGYCKTADVYIIVAKKIQMAAMIPFYEYAVKGKEGAKYLRKYQELSRSGPKTDEDFYKLALYRTKALEQLDDDSPINKLLNNPIGSDSQMEFLEKVYGFLNLTGEAFIWKERLSMGANEGKVINITTLPSNYMQIIPDGFYPALGVAGYIYDLYGRLPIKVDDMLHVKYFNPEFDNAGGQLHGLSPLKAGYKLMRNAEANTDSQIAMYENGGPPLIVYNENARELTPEQAALFKTRFYNETTGVANKNKIMLSSGKLGAIQTGMSAVDMALIDSAKFNFEELCGIFKMPSGIYLNDKSSYNNQNTFEKMAYTHGIMPDVLRVRDTFNRGLLPDFGLVGKSFIDADFSNISALQTDMKALSEWLEKSPEITLNERREMKSFERLPDPNLDKIYVPSSWVSLDDLSLKPDDLADDVDRLNEDGLNDYR